MKLIFWHRFIFFGPVRTLLLGFGVFLCASVMFFLLGCDKAERHKVLTFFFDGVPPLAIEYLDPNSPEYMAQVKEFEAVSRSSRHQTGKDCKHCHDDGVLKIPIPKLCYTCHDDYTEQNIHVHAPVIVGDCLFCHKPHESSKPFLLKDDVPGLCYSCHDRRAVALIDGHSNAEYNSCLGCHTGHGSNVRGLLKSDSIVAPKTPLNEEEKDMSVE